MDNEENFDDVIEVILAGAKSQPRSVLQIFRSFLNRWEIVKIRRETNGNYPVDDSKLLALILVLQNDYPELFLRILHYPAHLLYLYSLIKQKSLGNFFSIIDLDEINNLGVVVDSNTKEYAYDVMYKQELRQLFGAIEESIKIGNEFDINVWAKVVNEYVTLSSEQPVLLSHNDFLETLFSGDIVRIQRDLEGSKDIFEQHALGKLTVLLEMLKEIEDKKVDDISHNNVIEQIEKLIVPWGYFEKLESLYKLEELILKNRELPINLRMRCLYIFFKQAYRRENSDKKAINILLGILEEDN